MGEKASIFQTVQLGLESVVGTPVAANKKLLAMGIVPQPRTEGDSFRPAGNKYPAFVSLNKEWSELAIDGRLTYNEILYVMSSLLSRPTPAQQGATAAYKWTFVSDTDGEDVGDTFTIEQGDANNAWRVAGGRVSGLTFVFNRNEVSVKGAGFAEALETGITLTAAPTSMTPKLVLPTHLSFKMASTQAGLAGATALTRGFSSEFSLVNKVGLAWPVGQDPVTVETEPDLSAKLKLATDATGMGLVTQMRNGSTYWFRIKATGALIASTYYYDFQLDFPAQIESLGDFADESGIYAMEYGLTPVHDATWGKSFQIDVITDVQTL
jgi:hypothetical protein